jgi:hypothetical protein
MGLGDLFKKTVVCPECRARGAVKTAFGRVRCPNRSCQHYDADVVYEAGERAQGAPTPGAVPQGTFDPGADRILLRYRNFRGDDTEYVGDRRTIRFKKAHVTLRVAPTGKRIALWKKFIKNLEDLRPYERREEATAVERQILGYHRKHGTTSPRYEELRRTYPEWSP